MLTNTDVKAFFLLVDKAVADDAAPPGDPSTSPFALVHSLICIPDGRPFSDLRKFLGLLVSRTVLEPKLALYRDVIRFLQFGTNNAKRFRGFSEESDWIQAIRILNDPEVRRRAGFDPESLIGISRELSVGRAAQYLSAAGYRFRPDAAGILFQSGELTRCCEDLVRRIRKVSGQRLLDNLFQRLAASTPFVRGRFLISRQSRSGHGPFEPSIPYGYLINLALANLSDAAQPAKKYPRKLQEIVDLATHIVAVCNIETFSPYGHAFQNAESLPQYLQDIVLGDQLITFRQVATSTAVTIIEGVFTWIDAPTVEAILGWTVQDALTFAEKLWKRAPAHCAGMLLSRAALDACALRPTVLAEMLPAMTHKRHEINKGYVTPFDAARANAFLKPLVRLGSDRYFLIAPPISSMAFYEATASAMRRRLKRDVDSEIGHCVESMLATAFKRHGIKPSVVSKKYGVWDCDLIVESPSAVILIETKKKSLTRQAQAGNTVTTFVDVVAGVMSAQLQLGRHEIQLLKHGHIAFNDGTRIDLFGRIIARLAVTLLDWGGTQDRVVLKELASQLVGATLSSPVAEYQQAFDKANVTLKALERQQIELQSVGKNIRAPLGNWWFLSVPQLLFALDGVATVQEFEGRLKSVSSITFGQLDFYRELYNVESWRKDAAT